MTGHPAAERCAFAARAERARELADRTPAAAELLRFYAELAEYQRQLADGMPGGVDAEWIDRSAHDLAAWLLRAAPPGLGATSDALRGVTALARDAVLQAVWGMRTAPEGAPGAPQRCPVCENLPVVGVLREAGHGARRRLVCGLCATEWDALRIVCVSCGEEKFDALPVFTAEQFPHARIDACDTCRSYLKTIDATRDGRAIPVVDDLATVALDLWAQAQGYARIRPNLMGI
jgi:FdhE protein